MAADPGQVRAWRRPGVALAALKLAKARVFKGYKSWWCNCAMEAAICRTETALKLIDDMTPPPSRKLVRMEKMTPTDKQ